MARLPAGRRERLLLGLAALLVLGPLIFNVARAPDHSASVELHPVLDRGLPPNDDPAYYRALMVDFQLRVNMRKNIGGLASAGLYDDVTFERTPRRTVLMMAAAATPDDAATFANALAPQLAGASKRELQRSTLVIARRLRGALARRPPRAERRRLRSELRRIEALLNEPHERIVLGPAATPPNVDNWADRIADALPGELPGRPSPLWAAFAGAVVAATLWLIAFVLFPRVGRGGTDRPGSDPSDPSDPPPDSAPAAAPPPSEPEEGGPEAGRAGTRLLEYLPASAALRAAWLVAIALVPLITAALVATRGVNVPFGDQWTGLGVLFERAEAGTLVFNDFWAQHNEHRPLIPRVFQFAMAYVTAWDIRAELAVNLAVAVATFVLLLVVLRRSLDRLAYLAAACATSVLFFSPIQYENWLWGWQLEWFLANLAAVGVAWALTVTIDRSPRRGLAIAAGCAVVATFSLGQGLLVWPAGLAVLLLRRRPWRAWAGIAAAVILVYYGNYTEPGYHPSKTLFLEQPVDFVLFVLLYFGRSLAFSQATGAVVGTAMVLGFLAGLAYVFLHRRDRALVEAAAPWVGIGLYAFGSGIITAVSRLGFGTAYAGISRYSTMTALFAIATMALLATIARTPHGRELPVQLRRWAPAALVVPLILVGVGNIPNALRKADDFSNEMATYAECSRTVKSPSDPCMNLPLLAPNREQRAQRAANIIFLRERGWAGY